MSLTELLRPDANAARMRVALDGVRLGLTAHAEAEDIVLYPVFARIQTTPMLRMLIEQARVAHVEQEAALRDVVLTPIQNSGWRNLVERLSGAVTRHADQEEQQLIPALRQVAPADLYRSLAGAYATERLRQLSMMQPSAPAAVFTPARMERQ